MVSSSQHVEDYVGQSLIMSTKLGDVRFIPIMPLTLTGCCASAVRRRGDLIYQSCWHISMYFNENIILFYIDATDTRANVIRQRPSQVSGVASRLCMAIYINCIVRTPRFVPEYPLGARLHWCLTFILSFSSLQYPNQLCFDPRACTQWMWSLQILSCGTCSRGTVLVLSIQYVDYLRYCIVFHTKRKMIACAFLSKRGLFKCV